MQPSGASQADGPTGEWTTDDLDESVLIITKVVVKLDRGRSIVSDPVSMGLAILCALPCVGKTPQLAGETWNKMIKIIVRDGKTSSGRSLLAPCRARS